MIMKIELNQVDVKAAIAAYVNQHYTDARDLEICADDINLEVGLNYEDRPGGTSYPIFKKAVVQIEKQT